MGTLLVTKGGFLYWKVDKLFICGKIELVDNTMENEKRGYNEKN